MRYDKEEKIFYHDFYHPYRRGQNKYFDDFSQLILSLKDCNSYNSSTIQSMYSVIQEDFHYFKDHKYFLNSIEIVPSHSPNSVSYGLVGLARLLKNDIRWYKIPNSLARTQEIEKLSTGGTRTKDVHLNSIRVANPSEVNGKCILLIDDVTTSGNSLFACKELLYNAGASKVILYAIGKTGY